MRRAPWILLFLALATATPLPVRAQIINMEPLFRTPTKQAWSVLVEGSLDARSGNTRLTVFSADAGVRYRVDSHEFLLSGIYDLSTASDELIADRGVAHLRYREWLTDRIQVDALAQTAHDEFRRIDSRHIAGAGPRFVAVNARGFRWVLATNYLYEVETVDLPASRETRITHRWNVTTSMRLDHRVFTLRHTVFVQPAIDDPSNYRLLNQFVAALNVTHHLSCKWSLEQSYDAIPPPGVDAIDTTLQAGVKADW